jgi:uncharacterized C2H2 Zn-finger protein
LNLFYKALVFQTDPSKTLYICNECQNQLVCFHMYKRDVKKYTSFASNLRSLKILEQVDKCLNKVDSSLDLQVIVKDNTILVSPLIEPNTTIEHLKITQETEIVKEEFLEQQPEEDVQETEVLEEYIYETVESDHHEDATEPEPENQSEKYEDPSEYEIAYLAEEETNEVENTSSRSERQKSRKYKYPINTNDSLTDEEKDWINKQVRECTVKVEGKTIYKCPLCETFLKISGSLKKHLRDTHILKNDSELNVWNKRRAFKDEIKQSKIIVETADGPETIWKCQRCSINRIFRSEPGLKVHIRYSHIRTGQIDAKFIARCKTVIDSDQGPKDAWRCPDCFRVLKSRDGLRNHIKLEHIDTVATSGDEQFMRLPAKNHSQADVLQNLLERKRRTLKNESSASSCIECGIEFVNGTSKKEKSCRIHQECHKILNVVSQYYQLPKCDISKVMFSNNEDLNKYLSSEQTNFEVLPCDGMAAKVSQKFKEPVGTSTDDDSWKCGHCGGKYQTEFECNSHVMILHSKKLICPVDYMEFEGNRGISQFNIHMHNKHGEFFPDLVISCTYCSMGNFATHFDKLDHMRNNCKSKKYECDHCSKKYFTKTDLLRHLKISTGEIKYVCIICSKNCSSTMDLRLHLTSHTNQKAYQCSYPDCNKAFKTPAARSSHMETHGNISYACSLCSASFRQRALLQRHIKKGYCKGNQAKESSKGQVVFEETYEDV